MLTSRRMAGLRVWMTHNVSARHPDRLIPWLESVPFQREGRLLERCDGVTSHACVRGR